MAVMAAESSAALLGLRCRPALPSHLSSHVFSHLVLQEDEKLLRRLLSKVRHSAEKVSEGTRERGKGRLARRSAACEANC